MPGRYVRPASWSLRTGSTSSRSRAGRLRRSTSSPTRRASPRRCAGDLLFVDHLLGHAAIDGEIGTGDEAGACAIEQPGDDLGNILRLADAAGRVLGVILDAQHV